MLGANLWVGLRLATVTTETSLGEVKLLDERVEAFRPRADAVRVLVFGNSHAMHGLRPPLLVEAFGLPADGAFSLALPAGNAPEAISLAKRYLPRFPRARVAIVQVDEPFLCALRSNEARRRFLTRFDLVERLHQAAYVQRLDAAFATVAWLPFPIADANATLQAAWAIDQAAFLRRLAGGDEPVPAGRLRRILVDTVYPWGFPPFEWHGEALAAQQRKWKLARRPGPLNARARWFLQDHDVLTTALADVERLCRRLEDAGLRVLLVSGTLPPDMRAATHRVWPVEGPRFQAQLEASIRATHRDFVRLPDLPNDAFSDGDHTTDDGARTLAGLLASQRPWLKALDQSPR